MNKVCIDVGADNIVQFITDNGSNNKKASKLLINKYPHIVWQPCVAHTINLMLKAISEFSEHKDMIQSARNISRWLYNHNQLHSMMTNAIGGELIR